MSKTIKKKILLTVFMVLLCVAAKVLDKQFPDAIWSILLQGGCAAVILYVAYVVVIKGNHDHSTDDSDNDKGSNLHKRFK